MKTIIVSLLICSLIACAAAGRKPTTTSSIQLDVFSGSNAYWLAFAVRNAGVDTQSVQIKEAQSSSWVSMDYSSGWGYYTLSSRRDRINFPVSVRLTSVNGKQVTIDNAISSISAGVVNTGVSYGSGSSPVNPTSAPVNPTTAPTNTAATTAPTKAASATTRPTNDATVKPAATSKPAATPRPTKAAATPRPTKAATTKPAATAAPTKAAATTKPTSKAATTAPTTKAATTKPTTKAATNAPSGGCNSPVKLMVPLYTYPGASWDAVAASGKSVPTVAIINPNSGPGNGPDSAYNTYMTKLHNAGVEMVGYVHTSWGARSLSDVKKDIDIYASQFPLVVGIFLDEGGATDAVLPYYRELYSYIMSMPGWKYDIINPGTTPTTGYANAATQIVSFEDTSSKFASSSNPSYASCSNKDKFAVITYGASSSGMQSAVNTARSKGYYGWVYVTDGAGGCCTYNNLASYYSSMASYIASGN